MLQGMVENFCNFALQNAGFFNFADENLRQILLGRQNFASKIQTISHNFCCMKRAKFQLLWVVALIALAVEVGFAAPKAQADEPTTASAVTTKADATEAQTEAAWEAEMDAQEQAEAQAAQAAAEAEAAAQAELKARIDSMAADPDYIKASVVVLSPGADFYSQLGHCGIRMECPTHGLDYIFSFLTQSEDAFDIFRFFMGEAEGGIVGVPFEEYITIDCGGGRGLEQFPLNLTPQEEQRLWEILDNDMLSRQDRKFNFIYNNCTSLTLKMLKRCLQDDRKIGYVWPEAAIGVDNAEIVRYVTRKTPWLEFCCIILFGAEGEDTIPNELRMSPELMPQLLLGSVIQSSDTKEPMVGEQTTLAPYTAEYTPAFVTPNVLFSILIAVVVLLSLLEWKLRWRKAAVAMDATLLTLHTIIGIVLCVMTFYAGLFGKSWNWFLFPFNPLPLLIWLVWRKRNGWRQIYLTYSIVLTLFMVVGGATLSVCYSSTLLLVGIVAVRCWAKYLLTPKDTPKTTTKKHNHR